MDFFASLYGLKSKAKKNRIAEVLEDVNLTEEREKPFRMYSSGMRQKLILARALLNNPKLLLLDEPTAHIDPPTRKQFYHLISENFIAKRKASVLLCTHDLHEATELAQHIILLHQGKVIHQGSLEEIQNKIASSYCLILNFKSKPGDTFFTKYKDRILDKSAEQIEVSVAQKNEIPSIIEDFVLMKGELLGARLKEDSLYELFDLLDERTSK